MAKAYKCDKCGNYFDDKVYKFEQVFSFVKDHQTKDVNVTLLADNHQDKEYELCPACWIQILGYVTTELKTALVDTNNLTPEQLNAQQEY